MEQIQLEDVSTRTKRVGRETAVANMDGVFKAREFSWPCSKISSVSYLQRLCIYGFMCREWPQPGYM